MDNLQYAVITDFMLFDDYLFNELLSYFVINEKTNDHTVILMKEVIKTPNHQYIIRDFTA